MKPANSDAENPLDEYEDGTKRPEWLKQAMARANQPGQVAPSPERTPEELAEMRAKAQENARRAPLEMQQTDDADSADFFARMQALADREIAAWAALSCVGELEHVAKCSDAFAATCERRDHVMCPRKQLARAVEDRARERIQERAKALTRGVPERAVEAVIDRDPIETPAMLDLRAALSEMPKPVIVVLSGGVGCGKTCAAAWWAVKHSARFVTAADFGRLSPYDAETQNVIRAGQLVLDDLGAEYLDPKGFWLASFDALIDHRYSAQLPTVITTNLDVAAFKVRYGERVADRLREAGRWKRVGGASLRRAGR